MKPDFPAIIIGLHKFVPAILFLVYASEIQHLDNEVTAHPHECSGNTDQLHDALVGRSSLAMLSAAAGICLVLDTLVFTIRFGFVTSKGIRGKLEAVNHLFEFFTCAIGAALLHTVAQSEDGLAVQALYADAGCSGDYSDHLNNGLWLLAVAYSMVCLEFLIVRVQALDIIFPTFFRSVTGQVGGCDLRKTEASKSRYEDESAAPILGYRDDVDKVI